MSSRTAAWGQPPVSMAVIREGGRAFWVVRYSASSLKGSWSVSEMVGERSEGTGRGTVPSEDIVGHCRDAVLIPESNAQLKHQGCFA